MKRKTEERKQKIERKNTLNFNLKTHQKKNKQTNNQTNKGTDNK